MIYGYIIKHIKKQKISRGKVNTFIGDEHIKIDQNKIKKFKF